MGRQSESNLFHFHIHRAIPVYLESTLYTQEDVISDGWKTHTLHKSRARTIRKLSPERSVSS